MVTLIQFNRARRYVQASPLHMYVVGTKVCTPCTLTLAYALRVRNKALSPLAPVAPETAARAAASQQALVSG